MTRLSADEGNVIVETFYGINPVTYEVEGVGLTKHGTLRKFGRNMKVEEHIIPPGCSPQSEIILLWRFRELISFREGCSTAEYRQRRLDELRSKATKLKYEREGS